jgi:murein L,D-transpeptidase YcbB/YkuD
MTYLVLNPDWTVPPTILRLDKLPAIRKDPGYLAKQHMDVVTTTGRPVNPESIDWASFDKQRFPYFLRQRPGPWNALGQVKFIFPNDHFVFLHDTPGRELFAQSERSFSSGCIRVDQPLDLAALLLEDQAGYSRGEIDTIVASGETRTVFLKEPLPVLLQYLTAAELESGQFRFHRDIYKRDARVLTALNAPPPEHEQTEDQ